MAQGQPFNDIDIAKASADLDAELSDIFRQVEATLAREDRHGEEAIPEAEILPDDDHPALEILPDDGPDQAFEVFPGDRAPAPQAAPAQASPQAAPAATATVAQLRPADLARLIERAVEAGVLAALTKHKSR